MDKRRVPSIKKASRLGGFLAVLHHRDVVHRPNT